MSNTEYDHDFPVMLEAIPQGFWGMRHEITIATRFIATTRSRWNGHLEFTLADGSLMLLRRRGFWKTRWLLELEDGTELASARPVGFWQRSIELTIGDRQGSIAPQRAFRQRREYVVDGEVVAWTSVRGFWKRGYVVHAKPEVSEPELLFVGALAARLRQQQAAAASSGG